MDNQMTYDLICQLIEEQDTSALRALFDDNHPADIAAIVNDLPEESQIFAFKHMSDEIASEVLAEMHEEVREEILEHFNQERLVRIIDEMDTDEAADIISDLDEDVSRHVLEHIDHEDSENLRQLLAYDEESAGGLMQTEIIAVNQDMRRDELIELIRENAEEVENIHYVFVVDGENRLIGVLDLVQLLLCAPRKQAKELMSPDVISTRVDTDQEEVASLFRKYDIYALPVVDAEDRLLGRITVDDIIDVIDEEASEDAYRMVGLESEDKVFTAPLNSVLKRLPWLVLNLFTALLVSSVVGLFEEFIGKHPVLAVLMPIVAGLGGNSGTQTLTVITRGIALGELTIHNTWKALFKEVSVGIMNGLMVGLVAMGIAIVLKGNYMLGAVLGISMVCNMFIAALCGSVVPIVMKTLKIDPALASSVIITMLTDIGGFASFLGLASIFLV